MSKDAYWFKHDSNAKDDPKCVMLIEQLGLEGYGIYWVLVETLRDQPDYRYPLALIPALARRYNTSAQKLEAVIRGYQLFESDDEQFFFSPSLLQRMEEYDSKREQARLAGKKSAEVRKKQALISDRSTSVQRPLSDRSTIREEKSRYIYAQKFVEFYGAYPKKRAKQDAMKAWMKLKPDEELFEKIMTGLSRWAKSTDWLRDDGQFIPYPATWLNGRRWEDEVTGEVKPKKYVN